MKNINIILILLITPFITACTPKNYSFEQARDILPEIHEGTKTIYCGCDWKDHYVISKGCGYKPKKRNKRSFYLEWEHIVSASRMGKQFPKLTCYNSKDIAFTGRNCLRRYYQDFREMEGNLHNIWPLEGGLNITRSNKEFGLIEGEKRKYGICDIEFNKTTIEISDERMGLVARTYLYMASKYPKYIKLSQKELDNFNELNKKYPPSEQECLVNERISDVFEENPFIKCD